MIINLEVNNCTKCPEHEVLSDPDPLDSFCSDDVKVICKATKRKRNNITVACRPYNIKKESFIPVWCPKKPKIKKEKRNNDTRNVKDKNKERLNAVINDA